MTLGEYWFGEHGELESMLTVNISRGMGAGFVWGGNEQSAVILTNAGNATGVGWTNLIHIVNPQKIVIGGSVSKSWKFILPACTI